MPPRSSRSRLLCMPGWFWESSSATAKRQLVRLCRRCLKAGALGIGSCWEQVSNDLFDNCSAPLSSTGVSVQLRAGRSFILLLVHVAVMLMCAAAACCSAGLLDAALCCGREGNFQMAQLTLARQGSTGREALQQHLLQGMAGCS